MIEDQGKEQVEASKVLETSVQQNLESIEGIFPKEIHNEEINNKVNEKRKNE